VVHTNQLANREQWQPTYGFPVAWQPDAATATPAVSGLSTRQLALLTVRSAGEDILQHTRNIPNI